MGKQAVVRIAGPFILSVILSGCATIYTVQDPTICTREKPAKPVYIYSGFRCDVAVLFSNQHPESMAGIMSLLDSPLSLVADTIILPWRIYQQVRALRTENKADDANKENETPWRLRR